MPRRRLTAILAILGVGAVLRLWTIGDGLPYLVGSDEPVIFERVAAMMKTGDLNPRIYDYPGFVFYFHLALASVQFLLGAVRGAWTSLDQVTANDFYLWGRVGTALLGTLTIYVVYRAATRWSEAVALVAAVATAVQPQLVREAHYALTDTPLTFFVALTMLLSLRAAEQETLKAFAIAGLAAGLATGTKYNGVVAGLMPLAALVSTLPMARWPGGLAAIAAGSAAGFFAVAPYSLLDLPGFLNGFAVLAQSYNREMSAFANADVYRKYVQDWFGMPGTLPRAATWPAFLVMLAGFGSVAVGFRRRGTRPNAAILLVFPVVYFWILANQSLPFGRYAMPLVPAIAIGLAVGIMGIHGLAARRAPGAAPLALAALLLLVPPALTAVSFNRDRARDDTLELTARWIDRSVKPTEPIVLEGRYRMFWLPARTFTAIQVQQLIDAPLDEYRFKNAVYLVAVLWERDGYFQNPEKFPDQVRAYTEIFRQTELVQHFTPSREHPGPEIRILRLTKPGAP